MIIDVCFPALCKGTIMQTRTGREGKVFFTGDHAVCVQYVCLWCNCVRAVLVYIYPVCSVCVYARMWCVCVYMRAVCVCVCHSVTA